MTLALYDIDTNGDCHDYCYLLGDFNGWTPSAEYAMYRDEAKKCWWYTLEEYKIDGFRFDLTKGLTQTDSGDDDCKCSQYDPFRINVLKGYYDAIQTVNLSVTLNGAETTVTIEAGDVKATD